MKRIIALIVLLFLLTFTTRAQDLEPRRWTPIPLDMNIVGFGYGYTSADVLFDPVLRVEDAEMDLQIVAASYVTSMKLFGKLTRFDVLVPWGSSEWSGKLDGVPTALERKGFFDPRIRFSVNLMGTPALKSKEMREHLSTQKSNTVVGAAISISLPLGEYFDDKLINLGENRYTIRPQLGMVHTQGRWSFELTGSVFFYTDNDDFFQNNKREQQPLYAIQTHVIYSLDAGKWLSVSAGYGFGGQSKINGQNKDDKRHTLLSALSFGMPINQTQSIKVAYINGKTNSDTGINSDSFAIAWSKRF